VKGLPFCIRSIENCNKCVTHQIEFKKKRFIWTSKPIKQQTLECVVRTVVNFQQQVVLDQFSQGQDRTDHCLLDRRNRHRPEKKDIKNDHSTSFRLFHLTIGFIAVPFSIILWCANEEK